MENLTNPRNAIGDRAGPQSAWWKFPADTYLDHRHRNWVLAEEVGDVIFVPSAHVVLVHRERAEHIADLLGGRDGVLLEEVLALSARTGIGVVRLPVARDRGHASEVEPPAVVMQASSRWRHVLGWFGIAASVATYVAALALPLDDPALVVALMLGMRGGRLILRH